MSGGLRRTYDRIARDYALDHANDRWGHDLIKQMLARLPRGGRILDAGCGFGRECAYIASRGYKVIGIVFSGGMIREARRRFPHIAFRTMRLERLTFAPRSFDGIIARSSLLHISKSRIPVVLRGIVRVLKPSGSIYIAVKEGSGERWVTEADYGYPYQRFFSYFRYKEMAALLKKAGLNVKKYKHIRQGSTGRLQFIAEKAPQAAIPDSRTSKVFIFDWSGTLINNQRTMYRAVRNIFHDYGRRLSCRTFVREFRQPLHEFYADCLPGAPIAAIKKKLIKYYRREPVPKLFPHMRRQLAKLHKQGHKIFVFSSHPQTLLKKELAVNSLSTIIDGAASDVHDKKFELGKFIAIRGLVKRNIVYIGDMTDDIRTARKTGIESAAVTWGYHGERQLSQEHPIYILRKTDDIAQSTKSHRYMKAALKK